MSSCKSYSHFFSKKFQHICVSLNVNFNESLTNDVISFEQLDPGYSSNLFLFLLLLQMPFSDYMYEMSPSVHAPLTSIMVQAGDTAILTCRICGRPRPSITWKFKDSILLTPDARTLMTYAEDGFATLQVSSLPCYPQTPMKHQGGRG